MSQIIGTLAGAVASGKASGVDSGVQSAEIVDRFNRQLHQQELDAINSLAHGDQVEKDQFY